MIKLGINVFLLSLVATSGAAAQSSADFGVTTPGIHELVLPGSDRRVTLAIPDGYSGDSATPLIVSLHYGGRVTPYYGRGLLEALIEPVFRDLRAIIVAPDSAAGNWANPTSEMHVLELIDLIAEHYNIDVEKTLLTGYSMGGSGTWYLAPRHPDRFRAAIAMAGRPQEDSAELGWSSPFYVINSRDDEVVPFEPTVAIVRELQGMGAPIHLELVAGLTHYEISQYRQHLSAAVPWLRQAWNQ